MYQTVYKVVAINKLTHEVTPIQRYATEDEAQGCCATGAEMYGNVLQFFVEIFEEFVPVEEEKGEQ